MTYTFRDLQDETEVYTGLTEDELRMTANDLFWQDDDFEAFVMSIEAVIEAIEACDYLVEKE